MEVQKAIIIDSWNAKLSGVTISCKDKHVYIAPALYDTVSLVFCDTTLSSKQLSSRVNIFIICYFFGASFCKIKILNDKEKRIFCSIQNTICKSLKHKATIFPSKFYQGLNEKSKIMKTC